jgi:MoxR-like ATPase
LNDLLTGKHPKGKQDKRRPGFMVIGTQNPINMGGCYVGGRYPQSIALKRRLTTLNVPSYPVSELMSILKYKGLSEEIAINLAIAFQKCLDYANANQLKPAPTFRALEEAAKREIKKLKHEYGDAVIEEVKEKLKVMNLTFPLFANKKNSEVTNLSIINNSNIPGNYS